MGPETSLFTLALGLQAPWSVTDVRFDAELKEIPEGANLAPNSPPSRGCYWRLFCPACVPEATRSAHLAAAVHAD